MKCRKCGSGNMGVMPNKKNPSATDLYCLDCGAWQKFATKDEIRLYQCKKGPITNADRIRAMTDEELSEFISRIEIGDFGQQVYGKTFCDMCKGQYECDDCRLWWLRQPAEEDT